MPEKIHAGGEKLKRAQRSPAPNAEHAISMGAVPMWPKLRSEDGIWAASGIKFCRALRGQSLCSSAMRQIASILPDSPVTCNL